MIRTAVFGGSFDPPHLGHEQVVREVLHHGLVDEVWLLPVQNHPFDKQLSPARHRLAMLKLMLEHLDDVRVRVEDYELQTTGINYSYQTLTALSELHPDRSFRWVMGSDQLASFDRWRDAPALVRDFPILVYPRQGFGWELLRQGMEALTELPVVTASSTAARALLGAGDEVAARNLVLREVAEYSMAHHLYDTVSTSTT